jgi:spore coat-associated protein N
VVVLHPSVKENDTPMSRFAMLVRHPRRLLGALAMVLAAAGLTVASGADFTAQSANPSNSFTAGTLSMSNSSDNAAILTASNMRPGDTSTGTVDIANTGSLSGAFTLTRGTPVDSDNANPLSAKLNVLVDDCGTFTGSTAPACGDSDDVNKYTGTLAQMGTTGHLISGLGTYAGGDKHRYRFRVTLDSTADNNYQGDNSTVGFTWNAA